MATTAACGMCGQPLPRTDGAVYWDDETQQARNGSRAVSLQRYPSMVFSELAKRKGKVVRHETLYDALYWQRADGEIPEPHIVSVWISKLRPSMAKIGLQISNAHSVGYVLHDMEAAE